MSIPFNNPFSSCIKVPRVDGEGDPRQAPVNTAARQGTMAAPADMALDRPAFSVPPGDIERVPATRRNGLDALRRFSLDGWRLESSRAPAEVSTEAAGTGSPCHPPVQTSGRPAASAVPLRPGAMPEAASAGQERAGADAGHVKRRRGPMKSVRKTGTAIKHFATACVLGPGHSRYSGQPIPGREMPGREMPGQPAAGAGADRGPGAGASAGQAGADASRPKSRGTARKLGRKLQHIAVDWFVPARSFPFKKNRPASAAPAPAASPRASHARQEIPAGEGESQDAACANPFTRQPDDPEIQVESPVVPLPERRSMTAPDDSDDSDDDTAYFTPQYSPIHEGAEGPAAQAHTHAGRTADAHAYAPAAGAEPTHGSGLLSHATRTVVNTGRQIAATTWAHLDARRLLSVGDDRELIARLRAGDPETGRRGLASLRGQVAALKQQLRQAGPDPAATDPARHKVLKHFDAHIDHLDSVLRGLEKDRPWAVRAAIYGAMNIALPVLPAAVALESGQGKFFAELAGMYGKTSLMALGAIRSPTAADRHAIKDHFMQRHFLTLIQTAFHAIPSFDDRLRHLNQGAALNITAATLTTLIGIAAFFHEDIGRAVKNRIWKSPDPDLKNAWERLPPAESAHFQRVLAGVREAASKAYADIGAETSQFQQDGKTISPYTSTQLRFVTDALLHIARDVRELGGVDSSALATSDNPQWRAKLALALLNVAIGSTVTLLMIPDWIGVGGNAGDTLVTSGIQFKGVFQGDVSRDAALDSFRSWSGLSVLMLGLLALNKARGDFIERGGVTGVAVGATSLAILNAVLPGPLGHCLGSGIEKLMTMQASDFLAFTRRIGQGALDLFQQRAEATASSAASVRIEDVAPDSEPGTCHTPAG